MVSADEEDQRHQLSAEHRSSSWDHKPQALVYDPSSDEMQTEECGGKYSILAKEWLLIL